MLVFNRVGGEGWVTRNPGGVPCPGQPVTLNAGAAAVSTSHSALIPASCLPRNGRAQQLSGVSRGWLQYSEHRNFCARKRRVPRIVRISCANGPGSVAPVLDLEEVSAGCGLSLTVGSPRPHAPSMFSSTLSKQVLTGKQVPEGPQPWPASLRGPWLPLPMASPLSFDALSFCFGL